MSRNPSAEFSIQLTTWNSHEKDLLRGFLPLHCALLSREPCHLVVHVLDVLAEGGDNVVYLEEGHVHFWPVTPLRQALMTL